MHGSTRRDVILRALVASTLCPLPAGAWAQGGRPGVFEVPGGSGREDRRITVHFYRPATFDVRSPVLLIVPGSGRGAQEYLAPWAQVSDARGILVAALHYPEEDYDFAAYQMGGLIKNLRLLNAPSGPPPDVQHLRDEDIQLEFNDRPAEWLFNDFDRVFDALMRATSSRQTGYDIYGHSAGGQILHRLALFKPKSSARRIVAANAGFYTLPDYDTPLPFGLKGAVLDQASLRSALAADLTILLGELDNDPERGGQHIHTPIADQQGLDRLARGRHFFGRGREAAAQLGATFNWKLRIVPGIGHDGAAMSKAAAALLYP